MSDGDRSAFGDHLRRLREAAGFTQEELAERAGLSRDAVSALERGHRRHPHPQTVRALADALALSDLEYGELRASAPKRSAGRTSEEPAARPSRLPTPLTGLVGRHRELANLRSLLTVGGVRMVTLTGPGGTGKTRLALEVAANLEASFPGGAVFVSLVSVQHPALILPAIAEQFDVRDTGSAPLPEQIRHALRDQPTLLVLDNLEHLTGAAAPIAGLLGSCPTLSILATSRSALHLSGENEYPVPPLGTLPTDRETSLPEALANEAVALFVQRALAVRPDFQLTSASAPVVSEICVRLDGLPLAIELAAAWIKVLSPESLLARLETRLDLLAGGPSDLAHRLQSMRAAIAWSYDLLDPDGQALFRRLSAFADSFGLDAAEALLTAVNKDRGEDVMSAHAVLAGIAALVDRSVLSRVESKSGEPRFGMLSMIRDFGLEQLLATGELGAARREHERWYHDLAEQASLALRTRGRQEAFLDRLDNERGNFRLLFYCHEEHGDNDDMVKLAGALAWFWYIRGPIGAGRVWLERALAAQSEIPASAHRLRAMIGAGLLAHFQADDEVAIPWLEASVNEDPESGDPWWRAFAQLLLGMVSEDHGKYQVAETRFRDALTHFEVAGDQANIALTTTHLGVVAWGQRDLTQAVAYCEAGAALQRSAQDTWGLAVSLGYLGLVSADADDYQRAAAAMLESIRLRWEDGVAQDVGASCGDLGALAGLVGQAERSARLFGASAAIREEHERATLYLPERLIFERGEARARAVLGEAGWATAYSEGRALPLPQAYAEAVALATEIAEIT
jgi:predicted ATPase/transcriptional regulator with XRE-family HTH domain